MLSVRSEFWRRGTMARRVALGASLSAALGAALAAFVSIATIDRLLSEQVEQRLRAACEVLVGELVEEEEEGDSSLEEVLDEENAELIHSGIRLALYEGRDLVAGDPWVPKAGGPRCVTRGKIGDRVRACGLDYKGYRAVAAQRKDDAALSTAYVVAAMVALSIAAVFGALGAILSVRWTLRPLSSLVSRIRALSGSDPDPAALGEATSVVELESLRSALRDSLVRTRDHLSHVERFSADASHELLTPLAILRAELDLLAEDSPVAVAERLAGLSTRVAEVSELVQRLLLLSAPGKIGRELPLVSLASIAEDARSAIHESSRERVTFTEASEGIVRGDEALLGSLVKNALGNALKYANREVQLCVSETPDQSSIVLDVIDDGCGIPTELRSRVFEPFFRVRAAGPGHGLGLALIRRIAEVHSGTVEFVEAKRGTHLRVTLPRGAVDT